MAPCPVAWSDHAALEDVGVGVAPAVGAEEVALEVGERLLDLGKIPAPDALPAPVAHGATLGNAPGSYQVGAMLVRGKAPALAAVALWAASDADLVGNGGGAGGDEEASGALVGTEDLAAVELEETEAPKGVGGFGGGFVRGLRYSCVDQE